VGLSRLEALTREGLKSLAVIPFVHEGAVLGCLNLASHEHAELSAQTRAVIEAVAAQAAGAIARIRAELALKQSLVEHQRLERQILEISDREQARFGQDIHDSLANNW